MTESVASPRRPSPQHALPSPQQQQPQYPPVSQTLPPISSLTNGIRPPSHQRSPEELSASDSARDSGTWPQSQSKHTSAGSGLHVHTLLNHDDSPPRNSIPSTPLSGRIQSGASFGSQGLPSINQGFQQEPPTNRDSQASWDSRRSSVDSRMHQGLSGLYINNPQSPYESANTSQVSLAASLRRPNGQGPMSPLSSRPGVRPRIAPPIIPVGRTAGQPDPTAAKPTQGYAWAFPDGPIPEERRDSDSSESTNVVSRNNSIAASSIRSSIFSADSRMPAGQRRLDDDQASAHQHSMQHRSIQDLQQENGSALGTYSRTPELRVSHKLAERKRRSEMKDLFEDLNKAVPTSGGAKASKWEILSKAIDHIRNTQHTERHLGNEVARLQREVEYSREAQKENELLKTEVQVMYQTLKRLDANAPHVYGHFTNQLSQPNGGPSSGISLPPLNPPGSSAGRQHEYAPHPQHPSQPSQTGGAAMQGVEYAYGQAR